MSDWKQDGEASLRRLFLLEPDPTRATKKEGTPPGTSPTARWEVPLKITPRAEDPRSPLKPKGPPSATAAPSKPASMPSDPNQPESPRAAREYTREGTRAVPPGSENDVAGRYARGTAGEDARPYPAGAAPPASGAPAVAAAVDAKFLIRQALYPLVVFYTLLYFGFELIEFIRGRPSPLAMSSEMYMALLGAYAGDREIRHWNGEEDRYALEVEFIVYLWWLFYAAAFVATAANRNYAVPPDLTRLCLEVLAVFFGTRASKHFRAGPAAGRGQAQTAELESRVIDFARRKGRFTRQECSRELDMSDRHARRVLSRLVQAGILTREGAENHPNCAYRLR